MENKLHHCYHKKCFVKLMAHVEASDCGDCLQLQRETDQKGSFSYMHQSQNFKSIYPHWRFKLIKSHHASKFTLSAGIGSSPLPPRPSTGWRWMASSFLSFLKFSSYFLGGQRSRWPHSSGIPSQGFHQFITIIWWASLWCRGIFVVVLWYNWKSGSH